MNPALPKKRWGVNKERKSGVNRILIASDHGGFVLKEKLKSFLIKKNFQVKDLGTYSNERCDYPAIAYGLAKEIAQGQFKQGILICKTGIGNAIVANRLPGVRAALCYNVKAARLSRKHNDSNILVLGSSFVNPGLARRILSIWLNTQFQGGRHQRRLNQLKKIERELSKDISYGAKRPPKDGSAFG